jgi:hypothetical protein
MVRIASALWFNGRLFYYQVNAVDDMDVVKLEGKRQLLPQGTF